MTERELDDEAWAANPFTYRNNRGSYKVGNGYITYGLPPPPHGRKETEQDKKGGDRIGFRQVTITPEMVGKTVAVFLSIEEKTVNDRVHEGQLSWHNWLLQQGALSEIWREEKNGKITIITESIATEA